MTALYRIALEITRMLRILLLRVHYSGKENIPTNGGYVLACNHRNLIDPVILAQGIPRQVFYMAKAELFDIPVFGWLARRWGVFPVARGTGDMSAVEHAVETLHGGGLLGIFPEGTRSRTERPTRFKSGMAHIAKTAEVGVIPCAICYKGKMALWKKIEIKFGKPITYDELFGEEQSAAALKRATKLVMGEILEMLDMEDTSI